MNYETELFFYRYNPDVDKKPYMKDYTLRSMKALI